MSSLESCIRKAGKALDLEDANAIRAIRDDILRGGTPPANQDVNQQAVDEYLDILQGEKDFIMQQVEGLGGALADKSLSPSEFSQRAMENLDTAAKVFPRKGIYRPEAETEVVDYKTGDRVPGVAARTAAINNMLGRPAKDIRFQDPNLVMDLVTERTAKTIEMLYPDFYTTSPAAVLAIVNTFDPQAALGLAKHFDILPRSARKLIAANYNQESIKRIEASIQDKNFTPDVAKGLTAREADWFHDWAAEVVIGWIEKNETLPLYYKMDDDPVGRSMVDAHPTIPTSQQVKYGAIVREAETVAENPGKTGVRKLMNWVTDTADMSIQALLGASPQSKLPDFITSGMESVPAYTRTVKRMDAWMNVIIEGHHTIAKLWLEFNRKNKDQAKILGEFMHASTLAGIDVPNFVMPSQAELKKMNKTKRQMWAQREADYNVLLPFWKKLGATGARAEYQSMKFDSAKQAPVPNGMPTEVSQAQFLYLQVRDAYAMQRDTLMFNLIERINKIEDASENAKAALITRLRAQFEAGYINPYFPLKRFGKYVATAYSPEIDPATGRPEVVAVIQRESRRERNIWVEEMRKKGFNVKTNQEKASDLENVQSIDPGFVAQVTELFEGTNLVDKESGKEVSGTQVQDAIWQMYLRTMPDMSARKTYIHRKGRLGFSHDALRSFSDHSFHSTHQMAKLKFGYELNDQLRSAGEDAQILEERASEIKNMIENEWRPKGMEKASQHEVLMTTTTGGPVYVKLYGKYKKQANDTSPYHEPSHIKARDELLKKAEHDGPWAKPMHEELERRHNYNMNPSSAPWSTKLTAFGFLWFLSTSPAAGVLNLTQTAISAYPVLRAKFNGMGAGQELLKASKDYASAPWLGVTPSAVPRMTAKLKNDIVGGVESQYTGERAAMKEFDEIGIFSKTRTRELMGLSEAGSAYSANQERWLEAAGYIFHKTEEMNRAVTALAAYRLARKKLASDKSKTIREQHSEAVLMAEELVEMSHYDYTNTNRPRFMQGDMGRVVFLFRNYSLNMTYRLIRDFRDGVWRNKNISKEERREARSRFLGIIGMTSLVAGVSGWPLIWVAESVADNLLGDDDDPYDSRTEARKLVYDATEKYIAEGWGETVANVVMKGAWSEFTGTDLSQRASLNNLWVREIPENLKDDPKDLMLHLAGEALGPIMGVGLNFASGFSDVTQGQSRGWERMFPKAVADVMKSFRYATQGAQTYQRDMILSPEEFTNFDYFRQFVGFTPTRLATRYEQNRAIMDMSTRLKRRRTDLMNRLFMAWRLEDRKTAMEIMKDIGEWNLAQPRYPITPSGIKQSAKSRANYDRRTVGGVALDKRLQYLHEELRFTDRPKR